MADTEKTLLQARDLISLARARDQLMRIWLFGAAAPASLLVAQSVLGKYGDSVREVWYWFIQLVVPTIALMIGVLGGAAFDGENDRILRKSFFKIVRLLSIGYLLSLCFTIVLESISPIAGLRLYVISSYWLVPLQGLVVAAVGFLFTSNVSTSQSSET